MSNPNAPALSWNPLTWLANVDNLPIISQIEDKLGLGGSYVQPTPQATIGNIASSVTGGNTNANQSGGPQIAISTASANLSFLPWVVGFTVYAAVLLALSDTQAEPVAVGFAWLVLAGAVMYRWQLVGPGIQSLVTG